MTRRQLGLPGVAPPPVPSERRLAAELADPFVLSGPVVSRGETVTISLRNLLRCTVVGKGAVIGVVTEWEALAE